MSENGNQAPVFDITTKGVFGVNLPEKTIYTANIDNDNKDQGNVMGGGINGGINNDSATEDSILKVVRDNPGIKTDGIREVLDIPKRTLERHLQKMKDISIEYRGSLKTGGYFTK